MSVVVSIDERRAAVRVDADLPACLSETELIDPGAYPGDEEVLAPLFGHVVNLSQTGLLVRTTQPIYRGRRVRIVLHAGEDRLDLVGMIVRSRLLGEQGDSLVAIRIVGIGEREQRALTRLVAARQADPSLN